MTSSSPTPSQRAAAARIEGRQPTRASSRARSWGFESWKPGSFGDDPSLTAQAAQPRPAASCAARPHLAGRPAEPTAAIGRSRTPAGCRRRARPATRTATATAGALENFKQSFASRPRPRSARCCMQLRAVRAAGGASSRPWRVTGRATGAAGAARRAAAEPGSVLAVAGRLVNAVMLSPHMRCSGCIPQDLPLVAEGAQSCWPPAARPVAATGRWSAVAAWSSQSHGGRPSTRAPPRTQWARPRCQHGPWLRPAPATQSQHRDPPHQARTRRPG
jgi:hypothetical protein